MPESFAIAWYRCGLQVISANAAATSGGWQRHHRSNDHWVLSILLDGAVELRTANGRMSGQAPISWLCPPATPLQETVRPASGTTATTSRCACFNVLQDGDAVNPLERLASPALVPLPDKDAWRAATCFLQHEASRLPLMDRLALRGPLDGLLLRWLQTAFAHGAFADTSPSREPSWLPGLLVWIREQAADRAPTANEVVSRSGYGRTHCAAVIRQCFGTTIAGLVRRERMRLAADHLKRWPETSIAEIAHRLGYPSSTLFCRHFRQSFGQSPHRWRRHLEEWTRPDSA